jgi:hypothetical protein
MATSSVDTCDFWRNRVVPGTTGPPGTYELMSFGNGERIEMRNDTQGAIVHDGAVIEIERGDEAVTALVLLAGDELMILDACDGTTPFVVRYDEIGPFRIFEPELLGQAAA